MDILQKLTEIVSEYRAEDIKLTEDTTFDELGFDSLDKVELLIKLEEVFGFRFPDDIQVTGVRELIDYIKNAQKK